MPEAPPVLDQLLTVTALLNEDMSRSFTGTPLTMSRTHLLWQLDRSGPSTQQSLAEALKVSARNVSGLVDALEASGYVLREPHPYDRRAVQVTLTEQGTHAMEQMAHQHVQLAGQLIEGLENDEAAQLSTGLAHVIARLRTLTQESIGRTDPAAKEAAQ